MEDFLPAVLVLPVLPEAVVFFFSAFKRDAWVTPVALAICLS